MIILSEATHLIQIFQCRHHPIPGFLTCSSSLKPLTNLYLWHLSCLKHVCNYPLFHLNLLVYWLCIISNEETSEKDPQNEITMQSKWDLMSHYICFGYVVLVLFSKLNKQSSNVEFTHTSGEFTLRSWIHFRYKARQFAT